MNIYITLTLLEKQAQIINYSVYMCVVSGPVRIQVRIQSPYPLACRKRRLNGAILRMRPEKTRSRVTAGVAR
jgi:hypothetical protein